MILDAEQQTWIEVWWDAIHSKTCWKGGWCQLAQRCCVTPWDDSRRVRQLQSSLKVCDNFSVHSVVSQISLTYGLTIFGKVSCDGDTSKTLSPLLADLLKHLVIPAKRLREMAAEIIGCIFQHIKKTFATAEDACTGLNPPSVAPMSAPVSWG